TAVSGGAMIAIQATEHELRPALTPGIDIAALNSPDSTVISGDPEQAQAIADHFTAQGRKTRTLTVSHAFHSPHMDTALNEFVLDPTHPPHRPLHRRRAAAEAPGRHP
ncbi:acyltransferase domain-containing protein, partial [Streptomyces sp. NRRL F-525]|uniref:acyltransferase domain-containing protein n=1 Tax=Streptomyces sp. NRRL F-525 TaxID=1463861 RepID=UPI00131DC46B